jgi:calcineurin-like phosphoesterase family protein
MKLWLISDTHWNHANILKYCDRPFPDIDSMNVTMVQRWNALVKEGDWVIHCGDVAMGRPSDVMPLIAALSGRKVLCRGNHDGRRHLRVYRDMGWHVVDSLSAGILLFKHRPLLQGDESSLVIHGHTHGKVQRDFHIDVGVDDARWGGTFSPIDASVVIDVPAVYTTLLALNSTYGKR